MQTVGFEPTRANTLRPERSTLDHSVIFASVSILQHAYFKHTSHSSTFILPVFAFIHFILSRMGISHPMCATDGCNMEENGVFVPPG